MLRGAGTRIALPALLALAAANFLWQLGSSSLYVDEVQSLEVATRPLSGVMDALSRIEISPPAYFYFLHEWLGRAGSFSASTARVPSALCGVALVAAVWWLATLCCGRRAVALLAGALAALSPFVLEYAQRAQPYVFEMLAVTLAFALALRSQEGGGGRGWWLSGAAGAAALALCLHYTAAVAVAILCAWVAARADAPLSWRVGFVGVCVAVQAALIPLIVAQHRSFPNRRGVLGSAGVTPATVQRVFEAPFDGRLDWLAPLGVAVVVGSMLLIALWRGAPVRRRGLLLAVAAGGPLTMLTLSALGGSAFWGHLMLSRYVAFAIPFQLVLVAAAADGLWRKAPAPGGLWRKAPAADGLWRKAPAPGAALAACAVALAIGGLLRSHRPAGFYLDARGVSSYIRSHAGAGGHVISPGNPDLQLPLLYYGLRPDWLGSWQAADDFRARVEPLWMVVELPAGMWVSARRLLASLTPTARRIGYRPVSARLFPGISALAVVLLRRG